MDTPKRITVALAGNPNSGKTTIFNNLTGARQHVGNYPGVTIEKKEGSCRHKGAEITVVDLPGTYSLTAYSPEEMVARRFLLESRPDIVVCIIDASNLERNLYLAVQFMELQIPLILAFNMMDIVEGRGDRLDLAGIAASFGVPVVPTVGHKRKGMSLLLDIIVDVSEGSHCTYSMPEYGPELEEAISGIEYSSAISTSPFPPHWTALKLLEFDSEVEKHCGPELLEDAGRQRSNLNAAMGESPETVIAQERYQFIARKCSGVAVPGTGAQTLSDQFDAVLTHRIFGIPIFLAAMFLVFWATFNLSSAPCGWIESGIGRLTEAISGLWPAQSNSLLRSLLVDGIIGGVGNVIIFLPNILVLFFAIGLLEDSGYMPRAAFIMDRLMHKIGLHGKSSIPLLLGFGCSVPAIMATRTLESRRDRLTTMLISPLMSCGARLPIYALIIPAFFAREWQAPLLWSIYLIGIVLAIGSAKLLKSTVFKGASTPFVMELPPYRFPSLRDTGLHMLERSGLYLRKAGTIILTISMMLWVLTTFPRETEEQQGLIAASSSSAAVLSDQTTDPLSRSYAGRIGRVLEPILRPMGFDWKIGTALLGALAAKEVFVAQMGIVYSAGEEEGPLREQLKAHYSPLVGFCIMLFCLISAPCMSTIAVTWRESGSWRWALLQFSGLTLLAYLITTTIYQLGSRNGLAL